jgi:hypothetical protein
VEIRDVFLGVAGLLVRPHDMPLASHPRTHLSRFFAPPISGSPVAMNGAFSADSAVFCGSNAVKSR